MQLNFFYKNSTVTQEREIIINKIIDIASHYLLLPPTIDVYIVRLDDNTYGGVDQFFTNRIILSSALSLQVIPIILVHELIHIDQQCTGNLKIGKDGWYKWRGKLHSNIAPQNLDREEYLNLPWEVDVNNRLPILLQKILDN
jgi:hypothetical protein